MLYLKQSTAVDVMIGPFMDETDGKTAKTGLTISQADVRLSKNGGNMAQKHDGDACTHDEIGYYKCDLDTTDTGTLGVLDLMVHESGALPVHHQYMVVRADVYDTMCGSDYLQVDVIQVGSASQSATDLKDFADTGYDPATHKVAGVVLTDTCTTNTDMLTADDVWDEEVDVNAPANADSARETLNVVAAAVAGKLSGAGTGTLTFRDLGDTKARITATVDASNNRTAVTPDGT